MATPPNEVKQRNHDSVRGRIYGSNIRPFRVDRSYSRDPWALPTAIKFNRCAVLSNLFLRRRDEKPKAPGKLKLVSIHVMHCLTVKAVSAVVPHSYDSDAAYTAEGRSETSTEFPRINRSLQHMTRELHAIGEPLFCKNMTDMIFDCPHAYA